MRILLLLLLSVSLIKLALIIPGNVVQLFGMVVITPLTVLGPVVVSKCVALEFAKIHNVLVPAIVVTVIFALMMFAVLLVFARVF